MKKFLAKVVSALTVLSLFGMQAVLAAPPGGLILIPDLPDLNPKLENEYFNPSLFPPFLSMVEAIPNFTTDKTPSMKFKSSKAGTISYEGACDSDNKTAVSGENTITLKELAIGNYTDCALRVTDSNGRKSSALEFPDFRVMTILAPGVIITFPPFLSVVKPVETPTESRNPEFTFSSTKAGEISYQGACYSSTKNAVAGDNKVTFSTLPYGKVNDCKIVVTDADGKSSAALEVPEFTIVEKETPTPSTKCGTYTDVLATDSDCDVITYVTAIGAMTGHADGRFDKDGLLQRDQIAKIVLEAFGMFDPAADYCKGKSAFPDVSAGDWSYQYLCRAKELNVVTGYEAGADKGLYRPARSVNRAELLALVLRNVDDMMPSDQSVSFNDVERGQWYAGYAKYAKDNALFVGSNLLPQKAASRIEVARMLHELHKLGKMK